MPGNNAWGKIIRKAPVGKPISRGSRIKYFEITASVDSFKVLPEVGLSANCLIALAMDSNKIVLPHLAVFDHDSMKVVYVKKGSSHFEMRQVLQGQSSPTNTIISAGLDSGEVVTLVKPDIAKVQTTQFLPDSLTDIADNKTHNPENSKTNGKINPKIRTNE
jgi:HlyD family secretion protein